MSILNRTKGLIRLDKSHTPSDAGIGAMFGDEYANAVFQETTGPVSVQGHDGEAHVYPGLLGGMFHNVCPFSRVNDTGTTATAVLVGITF